MLKNAPITPYIPAADVGRAPRVLRGILGLVPKEEYAGGVFYECGGTTFFLYPSPGAGTSKASYAFWTVHDSEREVDELKGRGVVFEEYDMPRLKTKNSIATGGGART